MLKKGSYIHFNTEDGQKKESKWKMETFSTNIGNISTCLSVINLENILKRTFKDKRIKNKCISLLRGEIKTLSSFEINKEDVFSTMRMLLMIRNPCVSQIIRDYIRGNLKKYFSYRVISSVSEHKRFKVKFNSTTNFIFNFKADIFISMTGIREGCTEYELICRRCFVMSLLIKVFKKAGYEISNIPKKLFIDTVNKYLSLTILTGIDLYTEYALSSPYGGLFDELKQLIPLRENELNFKHVEESQIFEIDIKDSSFLSEAYSAFNNGYTSKDIGKIKKNMVNGKSYKVKPSHVFCFDYNDFLDKKDLSKIRITKGSSSNRFAVNIRLTGMRIISRLMLVSANPKDKFYADTLNFGYEYTIDNLVSCLVWRILWRTKQAQQAHSSIKSSFYQSYRDFIINYNGKRNLAKKTLAIICLSSKPPAEREILINKYFKNTDTKQKAEVRAGIAELEKLKNSKDTLSPIVEVIRGLRKYAW